MPADHNQLKVLLFDARIITEAKFTDFLADARTDHNRLQGIKDQLDEQLNGFYQAAVWSKPLPFDPNAFFSHLFAISVVRVPAVDALETAIAALVDQLQRTKDGRPPARAGRTRGRTRSAPPPPGGGISPERASAPDFNDKALAALQETRRKLNGRVLSFMKKGIDLAGDEKFKKLREQHKPLDDQYTAGLRGPDKKVKAKEMDVVLLKGLATAINASEEIPPLCKHYQELIDFLKERLPAA